ncbi:hypothetical protein EVAR_69440_1 [Eumeta japonica]|uniref:Uncharacterized protein n=1 Tax=Eumeta variegata TaxID=151549 RepID=A0A4C2A8C9_EUMVA|nr:hypothetical protein EVAR_69440_1 [Eumeta japonica]
MYRTPSSVTLITDSRNVSPPPLPHRAVVRSRRPPGPTQPSASTPLKTLNSSSGDLGSEDCFCPLTPARLPRPARQIRLPTPKSEERRGTSPNNPLQTEELAEEREFELKVSTSKGKGRGSRGRRGRGRPPPAPRRPRAARRLI